MINLEYLMEYILKSVQDNYYSCGLKTDGSIVFWGIDANGQSSTLNTVPSGIYSQISTSGGHACGLKNDGSIVCWGYNGDGQTTVPAGTYSQVSTGGLHTCGLKTDGNVTCWGLNNRGQATTLLDGIYTFSQISAGSLHSCGVKSDGSAYCWGDNTFGETSVPIEITEYFLNISTIGSGSGTVSGSGNYSEGSTVTLTATPDSNSTFEGWSPSTCNSFTMPAKDLTCTATFTKKAPAQFSVQVTKTGSGSGTVSGSGSYQENSTVNLTATPNSDSTFESWSPSPCADSFTMPAKDLTCTAIFTKKAPSQFSVQVTKAGSGSGTVSGSGSYQENSTVNLTATPNSDSTFERWSPSPCANSFTMPAKDLTCTATFSKIACNYSINPTNNNHAANAETGSITVTASSESCAWTATSGSSWVNVTSGTNGTGNGKVNYSVQANTSATERSSTITVAGQSFAVNQNGQLQGNLSIAPSNHDFGNAPVLSAAEQQVLPRRRVALHPTDYVQGQVIVKFKENSSQNTRRSSRNRRGAELVHELPLINGEAWRVNDVETIVTSQIISPDQDIEYIEPNYIIRLYSMPNDSDFSRLWGLHNVGQTGGTANADIDAPEAWNMTTGGSVVCGVIDTGVDYNHPDLAANIWHNPGEIPNNGIDDDGNGYVDDVYGYDFANNDSDPMDDQGHGTHVAGTIAGVGNNGIGITGINWSGKIMALKFMVPTPDGRATGDIINAIRAIQYATQMGVKCTNNSWGGYSQSLYDAIKSAGNSGSLFVAAAGNGGDDHIGDSNDISPSYPASYNLDNVISVCASDHNDKLAAFSNFGATSVDLCAPGVGIPSTLPNKRYVSWDGTSMAAPHVTGAVALLWAAHPELSAAQVKAKLMASVNVKSNLQGSSVTSGRLNLYQTLSNVTQAKDFTITNTGQATISSAQVSLTGQNPTDFKIQQNTCSGSLTPSATCKITVGFTPISSGSKQANLTVDATTGQTVTAILTANATAISSSGSNTTAFSFSESASYNPQTGKANLPLVIVAGSNQQYHVTLCPVGSAFSVCSIIDSQNSVTSSQLGNTVFNPVTGIAEIPVINVQGTETNNNIGIGSSAYSVKLKLVNDELQLIDLTPIW